MKKIAIACQGGGSHTAFTAGVLSTLAQNWKSDHQLVSVSGTSGGAVCAALFWSAFVQGAPARAAERLKDFWTDNSARTPLDQAINFLLVTGVSLKGWIPTLDVTPYQLPNWGELEFRKILDRHLHFNEWNRQLNQNSPALQVGAVEVLEGEFTVFDSKERTLNLEMVLASAAVPNLFRAVEIEGRHYWDGLFSHNPPILSMLRYAPDEVWVVQINPKRSERLPTTVEAIEDRRNELSGNLSLEQELSAMQTINALLRRGELKGTSCCQVQIRRIELSCDLNYASKLERTPSFIKSLMDHGADKAKEFLSA